MTLLLLWHKLVFKSNVASNTLATNHTFLNIADFFYISMFWRQLFHLFLADWEFPSLGIKQFQAGCGTAPTIIFHCFFLMQKMIYILTDSASLAPSHRSNGGLAVHPAAPALTVSFSLSVFLLLTDCIWRFFPPIPSL